MTTNPVTTRQEPHLGRQLTNAGPYEGPIISQQVIEVDHTYTADDLVAVGRDAECVALRNAVRWHCEGRILLLGNRTVVLR